MGAFWDERAREDPFFFVDDMQAYKGADEDAFWAFGDTVLDGFSQRLPMPALDPRAVVVDVGCGIGRMTRALAARVGHVHAIDVSAEMLERAREANPHLDNVTWHRGDGVSLRPLEDGSVDGVFSVVVFQHVPDPEITYGYVTEMGRVLRPGGWAAFHVSDDPDVHTREVKQPLVKRLTRRAPRGQQDPRWRGSAVDLERVSAAAQAGGCTVRAVDAPGSQFCLVLLERHG